MWGVFSETIGASRLFGPDLRPSIDHAVLSRPSPPGIRSLPLPYTLTSPIYRDKKNPTPAATGLNEP